MMTTYKRNSGDWSSSRTSHSRSSGYSPTTNFSCNSPINSSSFDSINNNTNTNTMTSPATTTTEMSARTTPTSTNAVPRAYHIPYSYSQQQQQQQQPFNNNNNNSNKSRQQSQQQKLPPKRFFPLSISDKLKRIPDPPLCFCGEAAFRTDSEMGIIYDCHALHKKERKRICGFHIHQRAWDGFRRQLLKGQDLDQHDPELRICPYFNYTFCVLFHYINDYPKKFPPTPKCFCNLQVIVAEVEDYDKDSGSYYQRIIFKCPHHDIDGAKPKCTWSLNAEEVPFRRPKYLLHSRDLDEMVARLRARMRIRDQQETPPSRFQKNTGT
ncbi:hypothetical protein INT45_001139 [Circinella minor]|uniref:Uncharacterized protein n=1 Tax=Circinella minor TaxID=1195481 RepID=A0A8H7S118_9FUNG|nr:hypothetical protein INT45_001139 [Circinella minor]